VCLGGFHIDHELKLGWLLNRQVGGLLTVKNAPGVSRTDARRTALPTGKTIGIDLVARLAASAATGVPTAIRFT
jgi:hypothetical protein